MNQRKIQKKMNKYLEKIAESNNSSENKYPIGKSLLGIVGGGIMANVARGIIVPEVFKKTQNAMSSNNSFSDLGTIKKMIRDNKLNVSFNTRPHAIEKNLSSANKMKAMVHGHAVHGGPANPGFLPSGIHSNSKDYIVGSRHYGKVVNKDVVMHELGHAKDFSKLKGLKIGGLVGGRLSGKFAPLLLTNEKTKDYAVPAMVAAQVPTIASEFMANKHAYKGIQAHKGTAAARGFVKKLLPSQMGGYLANAAISVGGVYAAGKLIDKLNSKT